MNTNRLSSLWLPVLITGLTLGTSWAVRGQFGHEQGAAWAGSIAALVIVLLARRSDWYHKLFPVALAAAVGWGLGGMMSYGIVVGYGHGVDFLNVYYGLVMLFVIGGLYGYLGGGLFGLALSVTEERPVNWLALSAYLVAGGIIGYFFLVEQWGMRMTPPRSELWAACLGMAAMLTWHLWQDKQRAALRVAVYAGLGAGFGFAFGNFLQVLGKFSSIDFNFWNVMEYSLGFFGGAGMAYGTFTASWEPERIPAKRRGYELALFFLVIFIPLIIWKESFTAKRLTGIYAHFGMEQYQLLIRLITLAVMLLLGGFYFRYFHRKNNLSTSFTTATDAVLFFRIHFLFYILLSLWITGAFFSTYRPEQYLYLINYAAIWWLLHHHGQRSPQVPFAARTSPITAGELRLLAATLIIMALLALVAMHSHGEFEGMHRRFVF